MRSFSWAPPSLQPQYLTAVWDSPVFSSSSQKSGVLVPSFCSVLRAYAHFRGQAVGRQKDTTTTKEQWGFALSVGITAPLIAEEGFGPCEPLCYYCGWVVGIRAMWERRERQKKKTGWPLGVSFPGPGARTREFLLELSLFCPCPLSGFV